MAKSEKPGESGKSGKTGKDRRGEADPNYEKRKAEAEAGAIEIDVHEEKIPEKSVKIRKEES
ncbi:MAG TPA: hypothetical protein DEA96_09640 [Leptospiraceae bacterium]|nr:hypothetical protein [Spirochaetaceae bacterium]HBS05216.1 hypothetical protein [Leptospiraceae bacterium]|tara:strand:- start:11011 stop:11196 length:186 start_codon:yes stop_codon:yes gene_type:complete